MLKLKNTAEMSLRLPHFKMTYSFRFFTYIILSVFLCFASVCGENIIKPDIDSVKVVLFPLEKAVISSLVDSSVKKYYFKEGEIFNEGDVIASLDEDMYQYNFNVAKAEYEKAIANYEYAKNTFDNNSDLYKKGGLSVQEYEKVKLDKANAYSEMLIAESSLKIAEKRLNSCTIKAPFPGRLTEKLINEHEFVKSGQPIVELINDKELLAVAYLPSSDIKNLREGMPLRFRIDETGTECDGKVYEVSGYIYSGSRTFEVKAVIENNKRELYSGMSGILLEKSGDKVGKEQSK